MYTAKIINVDKNTYHTTGEPFIDVEVAIVSPKGQTVETRKYAYPADITDKEIKADVQKMLDTFHLEIEQAAKNKVLDDKNAAIDATIASIKTDTIFEATPAKKKKK